MADLAVVDNETHQPFRWLVEGVLAGGPHPGRHSRIEAAQLFGTFDSVLSLFEERLDKHLLEPWNPRFYRWMKVREGQAPDLAAACAFIHTAQKAGAATLVHCWEGMGRTGAVLAAWLIETGACREGAAACQQVRERYSPQAIETPVQMAAIELFAKRKNRY